MRQTPRLLLPGTKVCAEPQLERIEYIHAIFAPVKTLTFIFVTAAAISLERPLEYIRRDDEIAHRVGGEMNADLQNEMGIAWDVEKVEHTHEDLQDL
jgi:hypothetical protein